jgi:ATP-dependent RNA helicase DOB1
MAIEIPDEPIIKEYFDLRQHLSAYTKDMREVINHPNYCLQFMQPGRLVKIKHLEYDFGWGAVVNFTPRRPGNGQKAEDFSPQQSYIIDVLLPVSDDSSVGTQTHQELPDGVKPPAEGEKGKMEVVPTLLSCVQGIGHVRLFLPKDLRSSEQRNTVRKSLEEVKRRFPDGIALLDPIETMGITDESFKQLLRVCSIAKLFLDLRVMLTGERKSKFWNPSYCRTHCTTRPCYTTYTTNTRTRSNYSRRSRILRNKLLKHYL